MLISVILASTGETNCTTQVYVFMPTAGYLNNCYIIIKTD